MSIREEQCNKVCRILDDVLANRPTERDSLIVAVRKALEALEVFGNSEQLPPAQPEPAITISWLEKEIERLESYENSFAVLDAVQLKALIKRWESEQNDSV